MRSAVVRPFLFFAVALGLAALPSQVAAAELDLTEGTASAECSGAGSGTQCQGFVDGTNYYKFAGALFTTTDTQPTGSGYIDSFVRIQQSSSLVVDGHNTSGALLNQEKPGPTFTHDVLLSDLTTVPIDGVEYYKFLLDINQTGADPLLTLSGLQLCTSTSPRLSFVDTCAGTDTNAGPKDNAFTGTSTLRYNLDASKDNHVLLDYSLNNGSGSGDLFVYIPKNTLLPGGESPDGKYLYLWSQFGLPLSAGGTNNDGYEEWAFVNVAGGDPGCFNCDPLPLTGTPEPASLVLLGTGLVAGAGALRRRNRQRKEQAAADSPTSSN